MARSSDLAEQPGTLAVPSTSSPSQHEQTEPASSPSGSPPDSVHQSHRGDKIHGVADVRQAAKLAFQKSRKHLFISWILVPIGCCFLCVACWALDLLLDLAPFSFPGPVLGTILFFAITLLLDWLSDKFPGDTTQGDIEQAQDGQRRRRKRFLDPFMAVLAPPCDFLLRNMSVLFTPSFIMIPARESIPGKEIGLLAGWFAITQVIGYVIPVLIVRGLEWMYGAPKRVKALRAKKEKRRLLAEQRRQQQQHGHRNSVATLPGIDFEKRIPYGGGERLGNIATGLSGVTAVVVAPVSHIDMSRDMPPDMRRHISHVALETARQQGEPMPGYSRRDGDHEGIVSDVSNFQHSRPHHHRDHHDHRSRSRSHSRPRAPLRSRSMPVREEALRQDSPSSSGDSSHARRLRPSSSGRPGSADSRKSAAGASRFGFARGRAGHPVSGADHQNVPLPGSPLRPSDHFPRPSIATSATAPSPVSTSAKGTFDPNFSFGKDRTAEVASPTDISPVQSLVTPRVLFDDSQTRRAAHDGDDAIEIEPASNRPAGTETALNTAVNSRKASVDETRKNSTATIVPTDVDLEKQSSNDSKSKHISDDDDDEAVLDDDDDDDHEDDDDDDHNSTHSSDSFGPDAIERLASWISDLLTPTIYGLLFVVGLPIFFVLDFALPLHLAINILTFWLAITVVPAKFRRYAHPILTTSIATVLIIWAFAAMRGLSLKQELGHYERRAKFNKLWDPAGYSGPAPGAGDLLASLLDAGIVALFVPLYRYRKDLKECGLRLCVALFPCACLSLFVWPVIASLMGLDQIRALAFAARFMSTPLAIQLVNTLGGDESITVILVVLTGIIAAIFKEPFFKLMRVDMDDHLTIGVTFGATSGAIGASSLIARPRVMALASLGFVIFGTMILIAAAIPPLVDIIRNLAKV
ncbi:unnamed protein product [Sympodiomycopsis kandeliae]